MRSSPLRRIWQSNLSKTTIFPDSSDMIPPSPDAASCCRLPRIGRRDCIPPTKHLHRAVYHMHC
eukprot:m.1040673 g.1040673  ORF g.1040673 m.1040673 type:complete len:64 (-) comp24155_c0_seq21:2542-2733(-)